MRHILRPFISKLCCVSACIAVVRMGSVPYESYLCLPCYDECSSPVILVCAPTRVCVCELICVSLCPILQVSGKSS